MSLNYNFSEFSEIEKQAYEFMVKQPEKVINLSADALAKEMFVSKPTIFRVCKKLGFSGIVDYKHFLIKSQQEKMKELNPTLQMVEQLLHDFDNDYSSNDIEYFTKTKMVILYATQASTIAASFLSRQLTNIGYFTRIVQDEYEFEQVSKTIPQESLIVAISNTGENHLITQQLLRITHKVPIFAITKKNSSLANIADSGLFHNLDIKSASKNVDRENQLPLMILIHELVERLWSTLQLKNLPRSNTDE